jgi:hypothetical protein
MLIAQPLEKVMHRFPAEAHKLASRISPGPWIFGPTAVSKDRSPKSSPAQSCRRFDSILHVHRAVLSMPSLSVAYVLSSSVLVMTFSMASAIFSI